MKLTWKNVLKGIVLGVLLHYATLGVGYEHFLKERYWIVIESAMDYVRAQGVLIDAYESACPTIVPGQPRTTNRPRGT